MRILGCFSRVWKNHNYIEKWPEPFSTQVEEVTEISHSCIADKVNDFKDILDALPQYKVVTH